MGIILKTKLIEKLRTVRNLQFISFDFYCLQIMFILDTAFMYIIGILLCLRVYQSRHVDLILESHFAFIGFGFIILTAVLGLVSIIMNYKLY